MSKFILKSIVLDSTIYRISLLKEALSNLIYFSNIPPELKYTVDNTTKKFSHFFYSCLCLRLLIEKMETVPVALRQDADAQWAIECAKYMFSLQSRIGFQFRKRKLKLAF